LLQPDSRACHYLLGECLLVVGDEARAEVCFALAGELSEYDADYARRVQARCTGLCDQDDDFERATPSGPEGSNTSGGA